MTFGKLKHKIKKLDRIVKLPDGNYSKEDGKFIKEIIIEFREFMALLSQGSRDEFEEVAINYKKNLNNLITSINVFIPFIQKRYNKVQFNQIKKRGSAWDKKG